MTEIAIGVRVPDNQRITYTITPLPGRLMSMRSIGGQMEALAKLLKAVAKEDNPKSKLDAYVLGIATNEEGSVVIDVMVADRLPEGGATRPVCDATGEGR